MIITLRVDNRFEMFWRFGMTHAVLSHTIDISHGSVWISYIRRNDSP